MAYVLTHSGAKREAIRLLAGTQKMARGGSARWFSIHIGNFESPLGELALLLFRRPNGAYRAEVIRCRDNPQNRKGWHCVVLYGGNDIDAAITAYQRVYARFFAPKGMKMALALKSGAIDGCIERAFEPAYDYPPYGS